MTNNIMEMPVLLRSFTIAKLEGTAKVVLHTEALERPDENELQDVHRYPCSRRPT